MWNWNSLRLTWLSDLTWLSHLSRLTVPPGCLTCLTWLSHLTVSPDCITCLTWLSYLTVSPDLTVSPGCRTRLSHLTWLSHLTCLTCLTWPACLTCLSHLTWLSHLTCLSHLTWLFHLTCLSHSSVTCGLVISMAMFWTSRWRFAFGLFSSSSAFGLIHILAEAKIGLKTTKKNDQWMLILIIRPADNRSIVSLICHFLGSWGNKSDWHYGSLWGSN